MLFFFGRVMISRVRACLGAVASIALPDAPINHHCSIALAKRGAKFTHENVGALNQVCSVTKGSIEGGPIVRILFFFGRVIRSRVRACLGAVAFAFAWNRAELATLPAALVEPVITGRREIRMPFVLFVLHGFSAPMSTSLAQGWRTEVYPKNG